MLSSLKNHLNDYIYCCFFKYAIDIEEETKRHNRLLDDVVSKQGNDHLAVIFNLLFYRTTILEQTLYSSSHLETD